jgi:transposase
VAGEDVDALWVENEALRSENAGLKARLVELETSLAAIELELARVRRDSDRHSGNSGKPPSSDTLKQKAAKDEELQSRAERRRAARAKAKEYMNLKENRRPGKQPGNAGSALRRVEDPDHRQRYAPPSCVSCGGSLAVAEVVGSDTRQVFDLPSCGLEVTEHTAEARRCGCGHVTKAEFPAVATAPACYGPSLRAVALYLMVAQHIPVKRTAALLAEVCGAPVSTGFLAGLSTEAAAGLEPFLDRLRDQLRQEAVLHADETGARISGARHWFHVACTDLLTLLDCHDKRGTEAFAEIGVLPFFSGVLVSDGWKPYWSTGAFEHAVCCAHLLRDLAAVAECYRHKEWADEMADLLVEVKDAVEEALAADKAGLTAKDLKRYRTRYTKIIRTGYRSVSSYAPAGSVDRDAFNLLRRFETQRAEVTRYWSDSAIPFDNNQAERDLRMVKLQQKVSGCFRTMAGAKAFCAVRSYIHTAQKHGISHLHVLKMLFNGEPWMPPAAGSSP